MRHRPRQRTRLRCLVAIAAVVIPWYQQAKADGVDPTLYLDFANNRYAANNAQRPASDVFSFVRATTGTYFDSNGVMQIAPIDTIRLDYDPVTKLPLGVLIEEARTNLVLNSATGTNQSINTNFTTHVLTFYGTGTVTLSGAATGSLTGSGAYPVRSTLVFSSTGGFVNISCTGTIQFIQMEQATFATSYIPTVATAVTRAFDRLFINSGNIVPFASWYNNTNSTSFIIFDKFSTDAVTRRIYDSDTGSGIGTFHTASTSALQSVDNGSNTVGHTVAAPIAMSKHALTDALNDHASSFNSSAVSSFAAGGLLNGTGIDFGNRQNDGLRSLCGHIKEFRYYPIRALNATLQSLTV